MVKRGLGDEYDDVSILPVKARAYLDLTKPASSIGVAGAFFLASLFYFEYTGSVIVGNLRDIIFASVTIALAHSASQALNMAEDSEMDAQTPHKQDRPIPAGIVTTEEARTLAWFLILAAIGRAYLTRGMFGIFITVLVVFGIFYNLNPIRAKERVISIPWQATSRGLLLFPAVWSAYGDPFTPLPWVFGVFMFWYVLSYQNSADIADREVDAEYNINTFIVLFGIKRTGYIATVGTLLMIVTILLAVYLSLVPGYFIWLLAVLPLCVTMLYYMIVKHEEVSDATGNSPAWLVYYAGFILITSIPVSIEYFVL